MPKPNQLLRLLLINASGGAVIGLFFALGLFAIDAAQLRTLILRDPSGSVALGLLVASFAITVAGLAAATAVMSDASYRVGHGRERSGRR